MDCIFCKIVAGKIPSYKVYEDESVLAFLDIAPVAKGHVLVIPKKHWQNMEHIPEDELVKLIIGVKKVGQLIKDKLNYQGYDIMENNDPVAGQVIPHIHWHIIPRKQGDGIELWSQNKYADGEAEEILNKMRQ